MRINLLVEEPTLARVKDRTQIASLRLASRLVMGLANERFRVIGYDFTPPHCVDKLVGFLRKEECWLEVDEKGISFELAHAEQIVQCVALVNWATVVVFRLVSVEEKNPPVPQMRRRWFMNAPTDWYEEHLEDSWGTCYFGLDPSPGFEIRTTRLALDDLLSSYQEAVSSLDASPASVEVRCVLQ